MSNDGIQSGSAPVAMSDVDALVIEALDALRSARQAVERVQEALATGATIDDLVELDAAWVSQFIPVGAPITRSKLVQKISGRRSVRRISAALLHLENTGKISIARQDRAVTYQWVSGTPTDSGPHVQTWPERIERTRLDRGVDLVSRIASKYGLIARATLTAKIAGRVDTVVIDAAVHHLVRLGKLSFETVPTKFRSGRSTTIYKWLGEPVDTSGDVG